MNADTNNWILALTTQRDDLKHTLDASDDQHRSALETIRVLAIALEGTGQWIDGDWHTDRCWAEVSDGDPCLELCAERRKALRLAKRLRQDPGDR